MHISKGLGGLTLASRPGFAEYRYPEWPTRPFLKSPASGFCALPGAESLARLRIVTWTQSGEEGWGVANPTWPTDETTIYATPSFISGGFHTTCHSTYPSTTRVPVSLSYGFTAHGLQKGFRYRIYWAEEKAVYPGGGFASVDTHEVFCAEFTARDWYAHLFWDGPQLAYGDWETPINPLLVGTPRITHEQIIAHKGSLSRWVLSELPDPAGEAITRKSVGLLAFHGELLGEDSIEPASFRGLRGNWFEPTGGHTIATDEGGGITHITID